jgi:hypothetical protein
VRKELSNEVRYQKKDQERRPESLLKSRKNFEDTQRFLSNANAGYEPWIKTRCKLGGSHGRHLLDRPLSRVNWRLETIGKQFTGLLAYARAYKRPVIRSSDGISWNLWRKGLPSPTIRSDTHREANRFLPTRSILVTKERLTRRQAFSRFVHTG